MNELRQLRRQLLEELIDLAYAERGYRPLSLKETQELVTACTAQMEALTQPPQAQQEGSTEA